MTLPERAVELGAEALGFANGEHTLLARAVLSAASVEIDCPMGWKYQPHDECCGLCHGSGKLWILQSGDPAS